MKRTSRHYRPKRFRKDSNIILYRRLFVTLALGIAILVAMYFWVITFSSNINNVWQFFRSKDAGVFKKEDKIPPAAARLLDIPEATNEKKLDLKGFGEEGSKAQLFLNNEKLDEQIIDTTGIFTFDGIKLEKGENSIFVLLTDRSGNEAQPSRTYTIEYDNESPKLTVTEPEGNEHTGGKLVTIAGVSEEGAYVTVNDRFARVKEEGGFEIKVSLEEGENKIKVEAKDKAGNITTIEKIINYRKED